MPTIQQQAEIKRLVSDDGHFDYTDQLRSILNTGEAFIWIECNTFAVKENIIKGTNERFKALMVKTEQGVFFPAELLEYVSEFRVVG
jgi:hypothetical protein